MGARSYVPSIGRFISPDPVAGASASAYDYAGGDPINGFDLNGLGPMKKQTNSIGRARAVSPPHPAAAVAVSVAPAVAPAIASDVAMVNFPIPDIPNPFAPVEDMVSDAFNAVWGTISGTVKEGVETVVGAVGSVAAGKVFERAIQMAVNAASGGARTLASLKGWIAREFSAHIPELTACATAAWEMGVTKGKGPWQIRVAAATAACIKSYRGAR
jgi:hypothetical protein